MLLMSGGGLRQLSQHNEDVVPQPAHSSQSAAPSVERAMAPSHGATGWACKATSEEADLERLRSARRAVHRDLVGAVQDKFFNLCLKGLTVNVNVKLDPLGQRHLACHT